MPPIANQLKKNVNLWIVEDSEEQTVLLKRKLEQMGWNFTFSSYPSAEDMQTALLAAAESRPEQLPNLLMLDLGLPGETGLSLLKKIHQHPLLKNVPVLVLTASRDQLDMSQSFRSGAAFFLKKPLDSDLLHQVLNQLKVTNRF